MVLGHCSVFSEQLLFSSNICCWKPFNHESVWASLFFFLFWSKGCLIFNPIFNIGLLRFAKGMKIDFLDIQWNIAYYHVEEIGQVTHWGWSRFKAYFKPMYYELSSGACVYYPNDLSCLKLKQWGVNYWKEKYCSPSTGSSVLAMSWILHHIVYHLLCHNIYDMWYFFTP